MQLSACEELFSVLSFCLVVVRYTSSVYHIHVPLRARERLICGFFLCNRMCETHRSAVSITLPVVLVFGLLVVIASYIWTWQNNDLPDDDGGVPFISNLGDAAPQWYFFAVGFTIVAAYFVWVGVVRFLQIKHAIHLLYTHTHHDYREPCCRAVDLTNANYASLVCLIIASACLALLAWFNDLDFNTAHNVFAVFCFLGLATYQVIHTIMCSILNDVFQFMAYAAGPKSPMQNLQLRRVTPTEFFQPSSKPMLFWYVVWNTISVIAAGVGSVHYLVPSLDGVPAVAEWALALSAILYFSPFYYETQNAVFSVCCRRCINTPYEPVLITSTTPYPLPKMGAGWVQLK